MNDVDHDGNASEGLAARRPRRSPHLPKATVDIGAVELQNVAPVAHNDGFATDEATNVNGDVTANNGNGADSDAKWRHADRHQGRRRCLQPMASPSRLPPARAHTMHGDGTFTYDFNDVFDFLPVGNVGHDSFTYTVADGNGGTDTATVTIDITGLDTNDTFIGTPGPDVFSGGVGNDTMIGSRQDKLKGDKRQRRARRQRRKGQAERRARRRHPHRRQRRRRLRLQGQARRNQRRHHHRFRRRP